MKDAREPRKKLQILLIALGVFFVSVFFRLNQHSEYSALTGDTARDLLVAHHIEQGARPTLGHYAVGVGYFYPPYYYYMLASLFRLTEDPSVVIRVFVIYGAIVAPCLFLIGVLVNRPAAGLFAGMLYSISSYVLPMADLWTPYVAIPTFFIGGTIVLYGWKKNIKALVLLGYASACFATVVNYFCFPLLVLLPSFGYTFFRNRKRVINELLFIGITLALLMLPVFIFFGSHPYHGGPDLGLTLSVRRFAEATFAYISTISPFFPPMYRHSALFIFVLLTALCVWNLFTTKKSLLFLPVFAAVCVGLIVLTAIKSGPISSRYYLISVPLLFLAFGEIIAFAVTIKSPWRSVSVISIIIFCLTILPRVSGHMKAVSTDYERVREAVLFIETYNASNFGSSQAMIFASEPFSGQLWDSPAYWFIQEYELHQSVIRVRDGPGNSLEVLSQYQQRFYLVCRWYTNFSDCLHAAQQEHPGYEYVQEIVAFGMDRKIYLFSKH